MSKQAVIGIGAVVIAAVVGTVLLTTGDRTNTNSDEVGGAATSSEAYAPDLINAAHQYNADEGIHIVAGETEVPTPCHILATDVELSDASSTASLNFSTTVEDEDEMCAQVITSQRFKATFEAPEDVTIEGTFNGQPVELNLQEVGPDENLEEFEVYTKG